MPEILNCRVNLQVTATTWMKHGDHPAVGRVPEHIHVEGMDKSVLGLIGNKIIVPGIRIIECGGNIFPVDDEYFHSYYEVIPNNQEYDWI